MLDTMNMTPAEIVAAMHGILAAEERRRSAVRTGLMGRIDEMLRDLPPGSRVAVSPPEVGDLCSATVDVAYTLRPLMAGMPAPDGWTVYARQDDQPSPFSLPACP